MATSKFNYYFSADLGAPQLNGQSGSLVNVLQACLVTGYGSRQPAGWSNPIPNGGGYGSFMPASGSMMTLMVNDAAPTSSITAAGAPAIEAMMVGWENLVSFTASVGSSPIMNVGSGSGQFPTITNIVATGVSAASGAPLSGSVIVRKSATSNAFPRTWLMFADAYTMYLFIYNGDSTTTKYNSHWFGDFFSLKGNADQYRCLLHGRFPVNNSLNTGQCNWGDMLWNWNAPAMQMYCPRTFGGVGQSIAISKTGDMGKVGVSSISSAAGAGAASGGIMQGVIPSLNPADNSLYLSPLWIQESTGALRGRMRGMWQVCHPVGNFSDGQIIYGANEYAGKTFQIVSPGENGGFWAIEISPTVETN